MSIATEFESTRENVQKAYTSLNKLGETASNKNIENISGLVDNLYNRLPKTEYQTGTNINLGKTIQAVVQYEDDKVMYGDTEQDSTTGYQLFNIPDGTDETTGLTIAKQNGVITLNGTTTGSFVYELITNVGITTTGNCTVVRNGTDTSNNSVGLYLTIGTTEYNCTNQSSHYDYRTLSATGNVSILRIRIASGVTLNNFVIKPLLYLGDYDSNKVWEPYTGGIASPNPSFPENINVVTGTQEVVVRGGNIFSGTRLNNLKVADLTGNDLGVYNITLKEGNYHKFIEFTDGTKWVQDIVFQFKDNSNNTVVTKYTTSDFSLTKEEASQITKLQLWTNATSRELYADKTIKGLLISQEISTYEPYITPTTHTLHLGNMEFAGIGNYIDFPYFDINEGKWYKKVNISKKILNTSNVTIFAYNDTNKYVNISKTTLNIPKGATTGTTLCSHFKEVTNATNFVVGTYRNNGNVDNLWVKMPDSVTTLDEAKAYLNTYNAIFYGTIRTPTTEEITDETLIQDLDNILAMMSVEGTTIIEATGNLPMNTKVRAVKGE